MTSVEARSLRNAEATIAINEMGILPCVDVSAACWHKRYVRLLVLMLVFALSGAANAALDPHSHRLKDAHPAGAAADKEDDCGDDCAGSCEGPCSPLCAKCTCSFGGRHLPASPVLLEAPVTIVVVERIVAAPISAPRAPVGAAIFHPPRA